MLFRRFAQNIREQNWFTIGLELVIVVVGVFVALWANSWWEDSKSRQSELDIRVDIFAEFEANLKTLDEDIEQNEQVRETIGFFDGLNAISLLGIPSEDLTERFVPAPTWAGFDPELGVVQSLVSSGKLDIVRDPNFRLLLSKWASLLDEKSRFNFQAVQYHSMVVVPTLARVTADSVWTDSERIEVQALFQFLSNIHLLVVRNQRDLYEAAQEIRLAVSE